MTPSTSADIISRLKDDRIEQWRGTIEQEIQLLISTAADLRQKMSESKTSTKKQYYTKKFKKISDQVMQALALQSQLPPRPQSEATSTVDTEAV